MNFFFIFILMGAGILLFYIWNFVFRRIQSIEKRKRLHPWFVGITFLLLCGLIWSQSPTLQSFWQIGLLGASITFYIINRTIICGNCGAFLNKPGWFGQYKECPRCGAPMKQ